MDEKKDAPSDGPTPVRDLSPKPRPVRPKRAKPKPAPSRPASAEDSRPTPVRALEEAEEVPAVPTTEGPLRRFNHDGQEWLVRVAGSTFTGEGIGEASGAPVTQLHFSRSEEEDAPLREAYLAGRDLDDLFDEELEALLLRARPVSRDDDGRASGRPSRRRRRR